jgi:hypothetical protein
MRLGLIWLPPITRRDERNGCSASREVIGTVYRLPACIHVEHCFAPCQGPGLAGLQLPLMQCTSLQLLLLRNFRLCYAVWPTAAGLKAFQQCSSVSNLLPCFQLNHPQHGHAQSPLFGPNVQLRCR